MGSAEVLCDQQQLPEKWPWLYTCPWSYSLDPEDSGSMLRLLLLHHVLPRAPWSKGGLTFITIVKLPAPKRAQVESNSSCPTFRAPAWAMIHRSKDKSWMVRSCYWAPPWQQKMIMEWQNRAFFLNCKPRVLRGTESQENLEESIAARRAHLERNERTEHQLCTHSFISKLIPNDHDGANPPVGQSAPYSTAVKSYGMRKWVRDLKTTVYNW